MWAFLPGKRIWMKSPKAIRGQQQGCSKPGEKYSVAKERDVVHNALSFLRHHDDSHTGRRCFEEGNMEKAEVKRIAHYIDDIERSLGQWDCQGMATYRQLIKLHLTIERLASTICTMEDQRLEPTLTVLEHKARRCKQSIEARLVHS